MIEGQNWNKCNKFLYNSDFYDAKTSSNMQNNWEFSSESYIRGEHLIIIVGHVPNASFYLPNNLDNKFLWRNILPVHMEYLNS